MTTNHQHPLLDAAVKAWGSEDALAARLGIARSTIYRWRQEPTIKPIYLAALEHVYAEKAAAHYRAQVDVLDNPEQHERRARGLAALVARLKMAREGLTTAQIAWLDWHDREYVGGNVSLPPTHRLAISEAIDAYELGLFGAVAHCECGAPAWSEGVITYEGELWHLCPSCLIQRGADFGLTA